MNKNKIKRDLCNYILKNFMPNYNIKNLPLNLSLIDLEIIDSFGIVEIVTFVEDKWLIKIDNEEINRRNFGSINKMVNLIFNKIQKK